MRPLALLVLCLAAQGEDLVVVVTGKASAPPDVSYLLMKMESSVGRTSDAMARGERQLKEFLAAAEALRAVGLSWRITNNVVSPSGYGPGTTYTLNLVFSLPGTASVDERDATFARLQDLGAKYNSHCVTCIGSG